MSIWWKVRLVALGMMASVLVPLLTGSENIVLIAVTFIAFIAGLGTYLYANEKAKTGVPSSTSPKHASPRLAAAKRPNQVYLAVCAAVLIVIVLAAVQTAKRLGGSTIPYDVLNRVERPNGWVTLEVQVSDSASKEEVLKLAEQLQREYAGRYMFINIFDSKEAWRRRNDDSYPIKEFSKHHLVQITGKDFPGNDSKDIRWVAEGRER